MHPFSKDPNVLYSEIIDKCLKIQDAYSPRESKNHRTRTGAGSKSNEFTIEDEVVRIYHSNSGKSTCTSSILEGFHETMRDDLLGPNSFLVRQYLRFLEAIASCNSREPLAVREEFPQGE